MHHAWVAGDEEIAALAGFELAQPNERRFGFGHDVDPDTKGKRTLKGTYPTTRPIARSVGDVFADRGTMRSRFSQKAADEAGHDAESPA